MHHYNGCEKIVVINDELIRPSIFVNFLQVLAYLEPITQFRDVDQTVLG